MAVLSLAIVVALIIWLVEMANGAPAGRRRTAAHTAAVVQSLRAPR